MDDENDFEYASKRRAKVNPFDEDVSEKELRKYVPFRNDDDEEDEINFNGTPVVKYNSSASASKAVMPDLSALAVPATSLASRSNLSNFNSAHSNSSTFGSIDSAIMYARSGHTRSLSQKMESKKLDKIASEHPVSIGSSSSLQDIDDAIGGPLKKQMSSADIERMQQEIQSLKLSLLSAKRDRWVKPSKEDTLRRIIKGEDFSLELYKSLEDKLELLDQATQRHDGNAITMVVLFLQRTVAKHIFARELLSRPVAANHYLMYLKAHFDHADYINTLLLLGRTEEAAIFKFRLALQTSDMTMKISKLKDSLRSNFQADPALTADSSLVQDYVDLLEKQMPIDEADAKVEAAGESILFKDFPRKRSLIGMPVVTTLYYCCLYHYHLKENSLASPEAFRNIYQISDKQFMWTAISARAKLQQWKDIETLLTTKSWFGGMKMKAVIGFDKIVGILHKNNAPPDILDKYLSLIDDLELRLNLAKKVSCSKSIVDTLVSMKNRTELETYTSKLDRYSKEGLYAQDILNSSAIKWK